MTGSDRTVPEPTLRAFLNQSCSSAHADLEAGSALAALLSPTLDLRVYDALLTRQYALNAALDALACTRAGTPWFDWFRSALRLDALREDIKRRACKVDQGLLQDAAVVVRDASAPAGTDQAGWAGWAYVVVGSLLGGRLIARNLAATIDLNAGNGAAFHAGGHLPARGPGSMPDFFETLSRTAWTADERHRMAMAAVDCMRAHQAWWCAPARAVPDVRNGIASSGDKASSMSSAIGAPESADPLILPGRAA